MSKRVSVAAAVCLALCAASSARAQTSDRASAEALFRAGRQANARGDYATACQRFEESNRLDPAIGTVFNLANCREKLGQLASAWQRYQEAIQKLPTGDERIAIATQRVAALEAKLPKLTLTLPDSAPKGALILKDGVELGSGSLGVELPVDPGEHVLIVRAPDHEDRTVSVTLAEGEKRALELEVGAPKPQALQAAVPAPASHEGFYPPSAPARAEQGSSPQRTAGIVIASVGAAGLVLSVVTGALVLSKKHTVDDNCVNKRCSPDALDAADSGRTLSAVSTVAFVTGAAALGGGIVLVLTGHRHEPAHTALSAAAFAGGGGLRWSGRF
jgi:hypothetical protein